MKIYLVRHGQTDWNYQKKIQGQQDVDINEQGIRQAEKLAEILKNVPFEYAVCSPLMRGRVSSDPCPPYCGNFVKISFRSFVL